MGVINTLFDMYILAALLTVSGALVLYPMFLLLEIGKFVRFVFLLESIPKHIQATIVKAALHPTLAAILDPYWH
jgi:hypothetical protein